VTRNRGGKGTLVLAHWNARSLLPKEEIWKKFLNKEGVDACAACETGLYKSDQLTDLQWVWKPGHETQPKAGRAPSRGNGIIARRGLKCSTTHVSDNLMCERIERGSEAPIFVIECHFPHSKAIPAHKEMWGRITQLVQECAREGEVVLMGDMNAHTKANGDTRADEAGKILLRNAGKLRMSILNLSSLCKEKYSRVGEGKDGKQVGSTIDYMLVTESLLGRVKSFSFGERLGSDHKVLLLRLEGAAESVGKEKMREVWKVEDIPAEGRERVSFVRAFKAAFAVWVEETRTCVERLEEVEVEASRIADILEWSFQATLDGVCARVLGTKKIGPKPVPMLDRAMRLLNEHRVVCERALKRVMQDARSTSVERAVQMYRAAKRELFQATGRRKEMAELELFRQVEEQQANSKLFWAKAKRVKGRMRANASPPPMVVRGKDTIADPVEVLRAWRKFSAETARMAPEEEGIYNEEYRQEVERRLELMRRVRLFQDELDSPITDKEVWKAVRKLKMGKAPGMDGILTSIIKAAADAVGKSELKGANPVIEALALVFNYVFSKEVWPERWGGGIIFPIYKQQGSRLEPGNYRPITLLSVVGKLFGSIVEARLSDWSEATGVIVDEQGGFRRSRGAPDQVFLLREAISYRKEKGLPTLVTYIDARKAYDTVWREGNYARLFDLGVRGKMWRQIQAMGKGMRSKVRLPIGETEWYEVHRGVAQGAAESPWLYSNFINGMATEMKKRGMGVMVAGVRIPLLMYADDIVLLANDVTELHRMNKLATQYAFDNRFRHNGDKSAIMMFNADAALRKRVGEQRWELSGERVKVRNEYKYLGVDVLNNVADWRTHIRRAIRKATHRSNDLLWTCGGDAGMRPRSAMTMWKAMVRPILEYSAELFAGEVPRDLVAQVERVQTDFAKAVLGMAGAGQDRNKGHGKRQGSWGVSNDVVRAELGLEKVEARWEKLRAGYWRRIQVASPDRALIKVARARWEQVLQGDGKGSWMTGTRDLLLRRGMEMHWYSPEKSAARCKEGWKREVYEGVERGYEMERTRRMEELKGSASARYLRIKDWGKMGISRAEYEGEVDQHGSLVCEKYLDDVKEGTGTRLKMMCRTGCLPVLARVVKERGGPPALARCKMCDRAEVEDIQHLLLKCDAHREDRERLERKIETYLDRCEDDESRVNVMLGQNVGCKVGEDTIDHAIKRFLKRAWRRRRSLTQKINVSLSRNDYVGKSGYYDPTIPAAEPERAEPAKATIPRAPRARRLVFGL